MHWSVRIWPSDRRRDGPTWSTATMSHEPATPSSGRDLEIAPVTSLAPVAFAALLGYGSRLWLEMRHPASGIAHTPAAAVSRWLLGATLMLPVTIAVAWAIAALIGYRPGGRARAVGGWLVAAPLAIAVATTLLLPLELLLVPDPHDHGELPPPSYDFGSFLELLRANVLLALPLLLLRARPERRV